MAFSINDLATELGIDPATLKPEAVSKWNGYLSEADTKYQGATKAQREAQEALENAQRLADFDAEQIRTLGMTEARVTELSASNAALQAALAKAKEAGLNIDLSGIPTPQNAALPDPNKILEAKLNTGFSNMAAAMRVQARYQSVFAKPFADDPVKLVDEAIAARMPVEQYGEQKYKFAEEQERKAQAEMQAKIAEGVSAGVKKYQDEHPALPENRGVASRHPEIYKPREAKNEREFRRLPVRERLAQSVARARAAIQNVAA